MMFKSIRFVLFISFLSIAVVGLLVFSLLALPGVKNTTTGQISTELQKQMQLVIGDFEDLLAQKRPASIIQSKVNEASNLSKSRVTIIKIDGIVVGDSATPVNELKNLENHSSRPEIVEARKKGFGESVRYSTTTGEELIYVATPLKSRSGSLLGFIRFSIPITYASQIVGNLNKSVVIALIAAILMAILLSVLFSRIFSNPVLRLSRITREIAKGNYPQSILIKSKFEVGQLEKNVEEMSIKLSESFRNLTTEKNRIQAIVSSMAEGVLAVDEKGKVLLANPVIEKLFNVLEPEILEKTYRETVRNNEIASLIEESMKSRTTIGKQISIITPLEAVFEAYAAPILNEAGNLLGAVCVLHDISELKRLENHRSEFVANVSHELKTPLTAIRNYVDTLIDGAIDDTGNNRNFLNKINRNALNLSLLIDDILELSKLESKKEKKPFSEVNISNVLERCIETIAQKAKKKKVKIKTNCEKQSCIIFGIEDHIYRAILNLIDNAINYSEEGSSVEISCGRAEGEVHVSVFDNGIGIPEDEIPRIFERFYRVDKARSRSLGGTGLGLSIVKHIMKIHNGRLEIESESGKGSKFTLIFPSKAS